MAKGLMGGHRVCGGSPVKRRGGCQGPTGGSDEAMGQRGARAKVRNGIIQKAGPRRPRQADGSEYRPSVPGELDPLDHRLLYTQYGGCCL
eukprot:scaffold516283_cov44-Prasinocladus_malaysianus.AAC.1